MKRTNAMNIKSTPWLRAFLAALIVCLAAYVGVIAFNYFMGLLSFFDKSSVLGAVGAWPYFAIAFFVLFLFTYAMEKAEARKLSDEEGEDEAS
jgi:TRAP-type C4-dicarboxylate transport system permease small subunit